MKIPSLLRRSTFLLLAYSFLGAPEVATADILVGNGTSVVRYRNDGSLVNASFISGLGTAGQIAVTGTNIFVTDVSGNRIGKYNLDGTLVDAGFVSGLNAPVGVAIDSGFLFVTNSGPGTVGRYDAATGAVSNATLVTGLANPLLLATHQGNLIVAVAGSSAVGKYSFSGAPVNVMTAGLVSPSYLAIDGMGRMFVSDPGTGTVSVFSAGNFGSIAPSLITGLADLRGVGIAANGDLLVANAGAVRRYTSAGALLDAAFITGVANAASIALLNTNTPYPTPAVTVSGRKKIKTKKPIYTLKGRSTDASRVTVKVGRSTAKNATGTASWRFKARLKSGSNSILVQGFAPDGTASAPARVRITRRVK